LNYHHTAAAVGGLLLALSPLGSVLASPLSGWLLTRYTARHLSLYGLLLIAGGTGGISLWQAASTVPLIAVTLVVQGAGLGLFQVANMDFVMGVIPRSQQGVAGSLTVVTRTIGVVGCATMGALLLGSLQTHYTAQLQATGMAAAAIDTQAFVLAFQWVFRGAAVVALGAAVLMWSSRFASQRT
jgi:MFS family permease